MARGIVADRQIKKIANEIAKREREALRLYEPTAIQEEFHSALVFCCLLMAGNQFGKSLAGFVELARVLTGQDPHNKYPKQDGIALVVGYNENHIGLIIHKYLFRRGAFKIIRDTETGKWRSYRPWEPADLARESETQPAPPLIPARFIKKWTWLKRSKNIFSSVEFHNGWVLYAGNSTGQEIQGIQADYVHFDEDIERPEWYTEMAARTLMRKGKIRWTAMPHEKNICIDTICNRAEEGDKDFKVVRGTIFNNPFMPAEARERVIKSWKDQGMDVYRRRALGERTTDTVMMYPHFSEYTHSAISIDGINPTPVQLALAKTGGEIPHDWCRYMAVDPGHTVCAVTFYAVPPPDLGEQIVCYDELYLEGCNATMFADAVSYKVRDKFFQEFIIDGHGGRLTDIGSGHSPQKQYSDALRERGIASVGTGSGFALGDDNIAGRELNLREYLSTSKGPPKMLFVFNNIPNLIREMKRFKKKKIRGIVTDTGDRTGHTHAVETLEYAAARQMQFRKPPTPATSLSSVEIAKKLIERLEKVALGSLFGRGADEGIVLGPQGARNYAR